MSDPFAVLGIPKDATLEELRTAYRRLARIHHPDVSSDPRAAERFIELQAAYEELVPRLKENRRLDELQARRAEREERYAQETRAKAEKMMQEARQAAPTPQTDKEAVLRLLATGQTAAAEQAAKHLLTQDHRQAFPHGVMGDIYLARGDTEKALQEFSLASQYSPDDTAYQRRVEQLLAAGVAGNESELIDLSNTARKVSYWPEALAALIGVIATAVMDWGTVFPGVSKVGLVVASATSLFTQLKLGRAGQLQPPGPLLRATGGGPSALVFNILLGCVNLPAGLVLYLLRGHFGNLYNRSVSILFVVASLSLLVPALALFASGRSDWMLLMVGWGPLGAAMIGWWAGCALFLRR